MRKLPGTVFPIAMAGIDGAANAAEMLTSGVSQATLRFESTAAALASGCFSTAFR